MNKRTTYRTYITVATSFHRYLKKNQDKKKCRCCTSVRSRCVSMTVKNKQERLLLTFKVPTAHGKKNTRVMKKTYHAYQREFSFLQITKQNKTNAFLIFITCLIEFEIPSFQWPLLLWSKKLSSSSSFSNSSCCCGYVVTPKTLPQHEARHPSYCIRRSPYPDRTGVLRPKHPPVSCSAVTVFPCRKGM